MSAPAIKARPTTYNGIAMRSRLEAKTAAALDAIGATWTYEPQAFATSEGQYLPDFRVSEFEVNDGSCYPPEHLYIEVRPTWDRVHDEQSKRERRIYFASTDNPLLYVGWGFMPLIGVAWEPSKYNGDVHVATPAVLCYESVRRSEIMLLIDGFALAFSVGFKMGQRDA